MEDIPTQPDSPHPRILLSRALSNAQAFTNAFKETPAEIVGLPLIEIQTLPLQLNIHDLNAYQWVCFTSQIAARHVLSHLPSLPKHIKIGAVGPKTARVIEEQTQKPPDFISPQANATSLINHFIETEPQGSILWPCGNLTATASFDFKTLSLHPLIVYNTTSVLSIPLEIRKTLAQGMDFIVFTSPSAVHSFHQHQLPLTQSTLVSIGPSTSRAIKETLKAPVLEASSQTLEALAHSIIDKIASS